MSEQGKKTLKMYRWQKWEIHNREKAPKKDMPNLASTSMKQIRSENHSQANKKEQ